MPAKIDWLDLPVDRAARLVALDLLAEASAARERLADAADTRALHDFRVALRRLRSWLRAFRGRLEDEPSGRVRRSLRDLASATGPSRDAEVQVDWLAPRRARLPVRRRGAFLALLAHFEAERVGGDEEIRRCAKKFDALRPRVERELLSYRPRVEVRGGASAERGGAGRAAAMLSDLVRAHADALRDRLALVKTRADETHAHEARIEGKRLRYLLEPLRGKTRGARAAVSQLKELQDVLGELHDAHVLAGVARSLFPEAPARRPASLDGSSEDGAHGGGPRAARAPAGVAELRALVDRRETLAFGRLERAWLASEMARVRRVHAAACAVADALRARANEGVEIERKFLLSAVPPIARRARYVTIDQGYLPGKVIGERIRRVRDGHRIDHVRSLKAGTGMVRMELEEKTPKAIFDGLWLLTKGRRLRKRRHVVPAGPLLWEIDVFLDRELVLAEVELPSEDTPAPIPDWLAPFIVREVTSERRYENHQIALARTSRRSRSRSART